MGAKAFEVETEKTVMAAVLAQMNIKYRFVFEAMPGKGESIFRAEVEAVDGRSTEGWVRFESMPALVSWLAQKR